MRVISKKQLREFWRRHPETESPLNAWYRIVERAKWSGPSDIRTTYRNADPVGSEFVVFDICNNDYRVVVRVDYKRGIIYVWGVYTHPDYDKLDLKKLQKQIEKETKASKLR